MITMYVGMALSDAPPEFRNGFQQALKDLLRQLPGVKILDFVGVVHGTNSDVYQHDRACTESADLCVFVTDYPSTGMGMEIVFRHLTRRPMLLFAKADQKISRMLFGFAEVEGVSLIRYQSVADIFKVVKTELEK